MADERRPRKVFAGEAAELAACIGPHVGRADFFSFDAEKSNRVAELKKVPELWRSLQKLSDNFSFQREKLEMALGQVWDEKSSAWSVPLSDQFKSDWTIDQANRLKHACLFIAQAMKKAKPAKWAIELLGLESMPKRRHAGAKQKKGDRRPADEGDGDRRPAAAVDRRARARARVTGPVRVEVAHARIVVVRRADAAVRALGEGVHDRVPLLTRRAHDQRDEPVAEVLEVDALVERLGELDLGKELDAEDGVDVDEDGDVGGVANVDEDADA